MKECFHLFDLILGKNMDVLLVPILQLLGTVIRFYSWVVFIYVIIHWLVNFGIVNRYNNFVMTIQRITDQLTEPALRPLRRILPQFSSLDLSPLVLILLLYFLENVIGMLIMKLMISSEVPIQRL